MARTATTTTATPGLSSLAAGCGEGRRPGSAVASTLVHEALTGPLCPAEVVAAGPAATYLDVAGDLLAVVAAGGVLLPCAVALADGVRPPVGDRLAVGGGAVWVDGRPALVVRRWFDPRVRVRAVDPQALARLVAVVAEIPAPDPAVPADATDPGVLLGRGVGLTPSGDDLVAGRLAALRARGSAEAEALGDAVRRLAPGRTTRLSAALLAAADQGAVVPEAAAVLRAAADPAAVVPAARRLLALGHTSGWYLAAGLAQGLAAVSERSERTMGTVGCSARRADRSLRAARRVRQ
ncbi:MAG TPA: DUF2877 domain-containing protein [Acidimicrobiales bacterium]|nr:DUF2877 domain-containing protein [Acidimicrobiales bacterium]